MKYNSDSASAAATELAKMKFGALDLVRRSIIV